MRPTVNDSHRHLHPLHPGATQLLLDLHHQQPKIPTTGSGRQRWEKFLLLPRFINTKNTLYYFINLKIYTTTTNLKTQEPTFCKKKLKEAKSEIKRDHLSI